MLQLMYFRHSSSMSDSIASSIRRFGATSLSNRKNPCVSSISTEWRYIESSDGIGLQSWRMLHRIQPSILRLVNFFNCPRCRNDFAPKLSPLRYSVPKSGQFSVITASTSSLTLHRRVILRSFGILRKNAQTIRTASGMSNC
uniref:(northern house mosquito) hypothetical protein n=1 Tax=Culex pipiens TaxID=7175 RepID=A0A8D8HP26_CULPI